MGAFIEKWYPIFLGVISSIIYYKFFRECPLSTRFKDLLLATVSISAIAVGFLATAKSIILAMNERIVIRMAKSSGLYNMLIGYMIFATYSCFFLSIISALWLLIDLEHPEWWYYIAFICWLFPAITSFFSFHRVIHLLGKILLLDEKS